MDSRLHVLEQEMRKSSLLNRRSAELRLKERELACQPAGRCKENSSQQRPAVDNAAQRPVVVDSAKRVPETGCLEKQEHSIAAQRVETQKTKFQTRKTVEDKAQDHLGQAGR